MSQTTFNIWLSGYRRLYQRLIKMKQKCHRTESNHNVLIKCKLANVLPNFTKIPKSNIKSARLSPKKIHEIRLENLNSELYTTESTLQNLKFQYESQVTDLKNNICARLFNKIIYNIEKTVEKRERIHDVNLTKKLPKIFPKII